MYEVEKCMTTHETAIKEMNSLSSVRRGQADPMAHSADAWSAGRTAAANVFGAAAPAGVFGVPASGGLPGGGPATRHFDLDSSPQPKGSGPWKLSDEKYRFVADNAYVGKESMSWLRALKDYLSGRTAELDGIFKYIEAQKDEILNYDLGFMIDCASMQEVSRQIWALLSRLLRGHPDSMRAFRNVPKHNGFRAWQVMAEPINEDKLAIRKELLPKVTNPRPATGIDDVEQALSEWDTSKRKFVEAGGHPTVSRPRAPGAH